MILSFFTKQATCKKRTVKVAVSATQIEDVILDGAPTGGDQDDADLTQLLDEDAAEREAIQNQVPDSAARDKHDTAVVSKIRVAAIQAMAERGVTIDWKQSKSGLQLIPWMSFRLSCYLQVQKLTRCCCRSAVWPGKSTIPARLPLVCC
jgi:hypothetical protein